SLSILEILVRIIDSSDLTNYRFLSLTFDESQIKRINTADLPKTWKSLPPLSETQQLGTRWVNEKQSLVLAVPSVIIPSEWNYMINPIHPEFSTLSINTKAVEFTFDERLLSFHRL
ncbi:RES family NAD+ phosphorylase, partial [bacterium]|nr:RES family NAD+ phosphorylase [bacterium]